MQSAAPPIVMRAVSSAAIIADVAGESVHGAPAALEDLPRNMRRRLSSFDRMVARCVLGLRDDSVVNAPFVLASNYGNMRLTLDLLSQLCAEEPMSPAAFSASVHNAAAGFASLLTRNHGGHTAVAAGADSAQAGLLEAALRLRVGEPSVLLVIADEPLPGDYAAFDPEPHAPAACIAIRLQPQPRAGEARPLHISNYSGRAGIAALARDLANSPADISCTR